MTESELELLLGQNELQKRARERSRREYHRWVLYLHETVDDTVTNGEIRSRAHRYTHEFSWHYGRVVESLIDKYKR